MRGSRLKGRIVPWVLAGLAALGLPARAAETNILLVTIDTLRPDRLSCYSPKFVRTPAIDALAAQGVLFERAFAHCPITLASHADILLGTTPLFHGVSENSKTKVADVFMTMAKHFKSAGYATGAFVGAFPLDSRFGLDQGFDVYDDVFPSKPANAGTYSERRAETVVSSALAWLGRQKGKWFCWVHVFDPHAPYDPPEPFASQYKSDPYSGEAAYVDAQLGRLFAEIRKANGPGGLVTVLTADHGESLGEHGELTHGYFGYNSTLHIPLLIAGPDVKPGRVAEAVSHIDIFPTICELAGLKPPATTLQGASLVPLMSGRSAAARPIYIESLESYLNKGCAPLRGIVADGKKFIDSPIPELYDLTADFGETTNLAPKTDLAPFRKALQELEGKLATGPGTAGSRQPVDRQTLERLRSLGYVAASVSQVKASYGPEDDLKSFLPFQQKLERAILLGDQGKAADGIRLMEELVVERKDFGPAYTTLSQAYMDQGQVRDAIRVLDAGVRLNPKNYSLYSAFGTLLVKTSQWDKAAEILGKALALIEYDPETWDSLGIVHMRQNDFPKALEYFAKAVTLDKSYALGYSNTAFVYFQMYGSDKKAENLTRAIENFRKATAVDPTMNLAWRGLGVVSLEAGKAEDAIAAWEKAVMTDPKDDYSTFSLGLEYLKKGEKARALAMFQKYVSLRGPRLTPDERAKVQALIDRCK